LSCVIAKVVFKLHPTCSSPVVESTNHPFETTQPGWGEFPATIEISFKDEKNTMLVFTHNLRLHHVGNSGPITKPVVSETYEEIVFQHPSAEFSEKLLALQNALCPPHNLSPHWRSFSDEADLDAIQKAHEFVKEELEKVVSEYRQVELELQVYATKPPPGKVQAAELEVKMEQDSKRLRLE